MLRHTAGQLAQSVLLLVGVIVLIFSLLLGIFPATATAPVSRLSKRRCSRATISDPQL